MGMTQQLFSNVGRSIPASRRCVAKEMAQRMNAATIRGVPARLERMVKDGLPRAGWVNGAFGFAPARKEPMPRFVSKRQ